MEDASTDEGSGTGTMEGPADTEIGISQDDEDVTVQKNLAQQALLPDSSLS